MGEVGGGLQNFNEVNIFTFFIVMISQNILAVIST